MLLGVGLYGYVIGSMTDVVTRVSYVEAKVHQQMDQVLEFVHRHKLPKNLTRALLHFFRHRFKKKKLVDERRIMEMMPSKLLAQCHKVILQDTNIAPFKWMDSKHFSRAMDLLLPRSAEAKTEIISPKEEPPMEFYILLEGSVQIYGIGKDSKAESMRTHEERMEMFTDAIGRLFDKFGIDRDGSMTMQQLKTLLETLLGTQVSDKQVRMTLAKSTTTGTVPSSWMNLWSGMSWRRSRAGTVEGTCKRSSQGCAHSEPTRASTWARAH